MVPIDGKPFLEHLINYYKRQGITNFVLATSYLKERIKDHFGDGSALKVNIAYSEENEPMGTGGAIKNAEPLLQNKFFVINGDTFTEINIRKMINFHNKHGGICTIGIKKVKSEKDKGFIKINENRLVVDFNNRDYIQNGLINAGIHYMDKKVLEYIPTGKISLENDVFAKKAFPMHAYNVSDGYFIDIGTFETYNQLINEFNKTSLCNQ